MAHIYSCQVSKDERRMLANSDRSQAGSASHSLPVSCHTKSDDDVTMGYRDYLELLIKHTFMIRYEYLTMGTVYYLL